jgi:hypothetical protein
MIPENELTKELSVERIRSRMLKNAARIWGEESEDIESSFDPVVAMLIEACATELNKINGEILSSQTRILSRLAQILSPEALIGPQPAHAIAHARSMEPTSVLDSDVQFYIMKKIGSLNASEKESNKEIFFSPLSRFKIFDAGVKYIACNNLLFEYKTPSSRQAISEGFSPGYLEPGVMWIGIDMNSKITSLKNLSFYFDWKNDPEEENHLHMLPLTKWTLDDKPLTVTQGILNESPVMTGNSMLSDQQNATLKIEELIKGYYKNHFYTITGEEPLKDIQSLKTAYPKGLEDVFSKLILAKLTGTCVWLKLKFTTALPLNAISDLYVSANSFPVINRKLNVFTYRLQNSLNIVPLVTEDLYHDLLSVQTSDGKPFISNPLSSGFKNEAGYYTLRYGGIERFDDRQATELLNNILDLLRDESAAFSSLGNDFINSYIRQINQALAMIENRIDLKGQKSKPGYFLLINPFQADENIYVRFWSTNGATGNQLKPGSKLMNYSGGEARSESLALLTHSTGGKDALNENEKITAYKKALLTHDRIVTEEDIRNTCFHELGNLIKNVHIRKSWEVINDRKQGIRRVLEVIIYPYNFQQLSIVEWKNLAKELKLKLELHSASIIPIQVVVTDETYSN